MRATTATVRRFLFPKKEKRCDVNGKWYIWSREADPIKNILDKYGITPTLVTPDGRDIAPHLFRSENIRHVVFDRKTLSYGRIIEQMERWSVPGKVCFYIYSPDSGKIVSAHSLLT